jgi:hypothetical protein
MITRASIWDDPECKAATAKPDVDAGRGRIQTRTASVSTDIGWLQDDHQWPGLEAVGKIVRTREASAKVSI